MHVDDVTRLRRRRRGVARTQKQVPLGPSTAAAHTRRSTATETIVDVVDGPSTNVKPGCSALSRAGSAARKLPDPANATRAAASAIRVASSASASVPTRSAVPSELPDGHRWQHRWCPRAKLARSLATTHRAKSPIPRARSDEHGRTLDQPRFDPRPWRQRRPVGERIVHPRRIGVRGRRTEGLRAQVEGITRTGTRRPGRLSRCTSYRSRSWSCCSRRYFTHQQAPDSDRTAARTRIPLTA